MIYGFIHPLTKEPLIADGQGNHYYRRSKIILDLPQQKQAGLPIRVIEALGAGKKLITTNHYIRKEPFYEPRNVSLIDYENPTLDLARVSYLHAPDFRKCLHVNWLCTCNPMP